MLARQAALATLAFFVLTSFVAGFALDAIAR